MPWERRDFKKYLAQTSPEPLMFEPVRGKGVYLYDKNDRPYLDLISGISVSALGHGNPSVIDSIEDQLHRYMHTMVYGEFVLSPQVVLAKKVMQTLPPKLDNIYLVNSGSEAVEGAIKLAYKYTGRRGLVACKNAYHGSSTGALSLMSDEYYSEGYKPLLSGVQYIEFNSVESLSVISEATAAVFVETLQGEAGYITAETEFMRALADRCREVGCLLVLDEIQAGMGRTGTFWAFEQFGIEPDILLTAKGFGGGLPLGAFISRKEIMQVISDGPILGHITTFGGNPVSCAAATATIAQILDGDLAKGVAEKEALFRSELAAVGLADISGKGLMLGVKIGDFEDVKNMVQSCLNRGLLIDWFLYDTGKLRICPPLTISREEIILACTTIGEAWNETLENKKR